MTAWYFFSSAASAIVLVVVILLLCQHRWRDSITLSILGWLLITAVVGALTGSLLLWLLGWPALPRAAAFTTAETLDLLKIALAVVAGFGGVVVLSVNHRKQRFIEKDHKREQAKFLNERFAAAAAQLAHDRAQVRLAGVYAMSGLADDWDEGRQKCVDVLIAYLRLAQSTDRSPGEGEQEVVNTIFRTIRERLTGPIHPWSRLNYDFTGMTLDNADFSRMRFAGTAVFNDVTITGDRASFRRCSIIGKLNLRRVRFETKETNLQNLFVTGAAKLYRCGFPGNTTSR